MQTQPSGNESPRYYQLVLQPDLLGGWTLIREWGTTGGKSSIKREFFYQRDLAENALMQSRDLQIKRGFQVMFMRGMEAPYG